LNRLASDGFSLGSLLLGRFGGLSSLCLLDDFLDDTDSDGLFHVSNGESTKRGVFLEGFNTHVFGGFHHSEARVSRFNEFGASFEFFTGSSVNFLGDFFEFDGNVCGVAIQDGGISVLNLTGVVKNNNLGKEG